MAKKLEIPYPKVLNGEVMHNYIFNENNEAIVNAIDKNTQDIEEIIVEARGYVTKNVLIDKNEWSEEEPFTQTVLIPELTSEYIPFVAPAPAGDKETAYEQLLAWSRVSEGDSIEGGIEFTCFDKKPTRSIPIQVTWFL